MHARGVQRRYRLLYQLEERLEIPMFLLAVVWLVLLVLELTKGLSDTQGRIVLGIWVLFIFEYLLKLALAPHKLRYIIRNWFTLVALFIPALRAFRLLGALRALRATPVVTTTKAVRALTSGNRFLRALQRAQGPKPGPEMNVGVLLAATRSDHLTSIRDFARDVCEEARAEMASASGIHWHFHMAGSVTLGSDTTRRPSDFLDDASLAMTEGPYDAVVVVTDVALMSRQRQMKAGLASSVTRIVIMSTRQLLAPSRQAEARELASNVVVQNGVALLLLLLGRISGLQLKSAAESDVMAPFRYHQSKRPTPVFTEAERSRLRRLAERLPERELRGSNALGRLVFHVLMAFRHVPTLVAPLLRNRALLLPLALPSLATAAVAPSFLLVFTAEIWDVGLNMTNLTAILYALISITAASFYLVRVQSLFLPRREKRVLTEHLAVANTTIFLSILLACIGLFLLVGILMFLTELYIFPEDLMTTWPTILDLTTVTWTDKLRLAAFISTVGVMTGALAGGLDSRKVIQHLALFHD